MLTVEIDTTHHIATLSPDSALSVDDFKQASDVIDEHIEKTGQLHGLIIHSKSFPGWDSFAALCSHLKFVKDHHNLISNIAIVTDSRVGNFAESIATHFINSTIKLFAYSKMDEAREWLIEGPNKNSPHKVPVFKVTLQDENRVDIELSGKLTSEDMKAALDELIFKSVNIEDGRMLYTISDFDFPSVGAIGIELSRFPELLRLMNKFQRCAVLADQKWIKNISELEGHLLPGLEIKAFNLNEKAVAEAWLAIK
jgi:hypothetical protein